MPFSVWIMWAILAVVMMVAEIFTAGFFLFWFGVGAIPSAIIAAIFPQAFAAQIITYVVVTCLLILSTRKFAQKVYKSGSDLKVGSDRMIDKMGIVTEVIDPMAGKGLVRVDHEPWRAESEDGEVIQKDVKVKVLRIDGTRLIVKVYEPGK